MDDVHAALAREDMEEGDSLDGELHDEKCDTKEEEEEEEACKGGPVSHGSAGRPSYGSCHIDQSAGRPSHGSCHSAGCPSHGSCHIDQIAREGQSEHSRGRRTSGQTPSRSSFQDGCEEWDRDGSC
eukprot:6982813-Prymnesium_polylepis.1